jgi:hypothetical protein
LNSKEKWTRHVKIKSLKLQTLHESRRPESANHKALSNPVLDGFKMGI